MYWYWCCVACEVSNHSKSKSNQRSRCFWLQKIGWGITNADWLMSRPCSEDQDENAQPWALYVPIWKARKKTFMYVIMIPTSKEGLTSNASLSICTPLSRIWVPAYCHVLGSLCLHDFRSECIWPARTLSTISSKGWTFHSFATEASSLNIAGEADLPGILAPLLRMKSNKACAVS